MPEGDTLYKVARSLGSACLHRRIETLWLRARGMLARFRGSCIREVAPLGKHLLIALDGSARAPVDRRERLGEWVVHVHLGMYGRFCPCTEAALPGGDLELRLERGVASEFPTWRCTRAAQVELLPRGALRDHPVLSRLGPDLLSHPLAVDRILERARRRPDRALAELLLDQQVACGIGNVYKNEVLFLAGLNPRLSSGSLSDADLEGLYRQTAALMACNTSAGPRVTRRAGRGTERHWVYRRAGRPCFRCGSAIAAERIGAAARVTYWCPRCQRRSSPTARAPRIAASAVL